MGAYWEDTSNGSMKRVGHYLATCVGEGNTFRMSALRSAIPGVMQLDRRMRDLRPRGWKILTNKERSGLGPDELLLERIGDHVWDEGYKSPKSGISDRKRRNVLDRDGNRCMVCGIDFGSGYPDAPSVIARGTIGHVLPQERGGTDDEENLRAECQRCNETARNLTETPVDAELVTRRIGQLKSTERQKLLDWMNAGKRSFTDAEQLWTKYNQLTKPNQDKVKEEIRRALEP